MKSLLFRNSKLSDLEFFFEMKNKLDFVIYLKYVCL